MMLALVSSVARAGELPEVSGGMRLDFAGFSGDRALGDVGYQSYVAGFADATARLGPISLSSKFNISALPEDQRVSSARVRELAIRYESTGTRVTVGRQIMTRGRADGINPSDVLTPWRRTELVLDDADQRDGRLAARIDQEIGSLLVSATYFYDDAYDVLPIPKTSIRINSDERKRSAFSLIVDRTGEKIDWSVSYYDGADLQPAFDISGLAMGVIEEVHRDVRVFSADVASNFAKFGMRAELACSQRSRPPKGSAVLVGASQCALVAGVDRAMPINGRISLQGYAIQAAANKEVGAPQQLIRDYSALVGQSDRAQGGIVFLYSLSAKNEALKLELPLVVGFNNGGIALRPKIYYQVSDRMILKLGLDRYLGDESGLLGRLRSNSLFFLGIQYHID